LFGPKRSDLRPSRANSIMARLLMCGSDNRIEQFGRAEEPIAPLPYFFLLIDRKLTPNENAFCLTAPVVRRSFFAVSGPDMRALAKLRRLFTSSLDHARVVRRFIFLAIDAPAKATIILAPALLTKRALARSTSHDLEIHESILPVIHRFMTQVRMPRRRQKRACALLS
jgi:hypothetical protein